MISSDTSELFQRVYSGLWKRYWAVALMSGLIADCQAVPTNSPPPSPPPSDNIQSTLITVAVCSILLCMMTCAGTIYCVMHHRRLRKTRRAKGKSRANVSPTNSSNSHTTTTINDLIEPSVSSSVGENHIGLRKTEETTNKGNSNAAILEKLQKMEKGTKKEKKHQNKSVMSMSTNGTSMTPTNYSGKTLADTTIVGLYLPGYVKAEMGVDYILQQKLSGIGGSATVHLGLLINTELVERHGTNLAVVKVMKVPEAVLNQEVAVMNLLRNNPSIAKLYAFDSERNTIVMKYYPEGSLYQLIFSKSTSKVYRLSTLVPIFKDVSHGLEEMHSKMIIHRDIKPDNILLDNHPTESRLMGVLADFGVSASIDPEQNAIHAFKRIQLRAASIRYASPEAILLVRAKKSDQMELDGSPSDVFAFGSTLFEALTRKGTWTSRS